MSVVHPVEIIDKNGKRNVVRKKLNEESKSSRLVGVIKPPRKTQTLAIDERGAFPEEEERKTLRVIRKEFRDAVEFRFSFEVDGGALYLMNREVVLEDGSGISDDLATDFDLDKLDIASARLAEVYYSIGSFGSDRRVRVVNPESENSYVAIRLK